MNQLVTLMLLLMRHLVALPDYKQMKSQFAITRTATDEPYIRHALLVLKLYYGMHFIVSISTNPHPTSSSKSLYVEYNSSR